ncbi:hypothetical protein ACIGCK_04675 [Microbacterium sp. NPDC078428]|uniref:hypothetical protein n=1 Tax=Microbacterium sp. NPDC078428 TaxID=3364190 RepID=UPI0037CA115A
MTERIDIDSLPDADPSLSYARRLLPSCVTRNVDTGETVLIPHKAFVFNPDLSIHQELIVRSLGSTIEREYNVPPNGALYVPVHLLTSTGALLKATPHDDEPVLGPAHHSLFGKSRTPSKTDKAAMRDVLLGASVWMATPSAA